MIDNLIMQAVMRDAESLAVPSVKGKFLVATGLWRMVESGDDCYVIFTDDYTDPNVAFTVLLLDDCELVEGEKLLMLTSVLLDTQEFSLVVFKDQNDSEVTDEADVG